MVVTSYFAEHKPSCTMIQYNNSQTTRGYPDVSANRANNVVAVDGSLSLVYGISASSPAFGSIITLITSNLLIPERDPSVPQLYPIRNPIDPERCYHRWVPRLWDSRFHGGDWLGPGDRTRYPELHQDVTCLYELAMKFYIAMGKKVKDAQTFCMAKRSVVGSAGMNLRPASIWTISHHCVKLFFLTILIMRHQETSG